MLIPNITTEFKDSAGTYKVCYDIEVVVPIYTPEKRTIKNIRPMSDMPFEMTDRKIAILVYKLTSWASKYSITELQQLSNKC